VLEVLFEGATDEWTQRVKSLPGVAAVSAHGQAYHISSTNGPATTMALLEASANSHVAVKTLGVQSTSLDDVFVHFTGRQLHGDQKAQ